MILKQETWCPVEQQGSTHRKPWRDMLSFPTMGNIVCPQLAATWQAAASAEGLFHLLRSKGT